MRKDPPRSLFERMIPLRDAEALMTGSIPGIYELVVTSRIIRLYLLRSWQGRR